MEEPVVSIVASLLDAVRPRLVEARRLGRDASEVFAAMNRAREALRLKIYSEALAASQEAIERVSNLTADLDSVRSEADSLAEMLERLASAHFPTGPYAASLQRLRDHLGGRRPRTRPGSSAFARRSVPREEAASFFTAEFDTSTRCVRSPRNEGSCPAAAEERPREGAPFIDDGEIADAGELLAGLEVRMRTAAGPYVARRVEELEQRLLGDSRTNPWSPRSAACSPTADVHLRVKEDLPGSLESLRRAEREFTSVFAAHASALVEGLEEERRTLEAMGGRR